MNARMAFTGTKEGSKKKKYGQNHFLCETVFNNKLFRTTRYSMRNEKTDIIPILIDEISLCVDRIILYS